MVLGDDFPALEIAPEVEELNLLYVAVTRGMKRRPACAGSSHSRHLNYIGSFCPIEWLEQPFRCVYASQAVFASLITKQVAPIGLTASSQAFVPQPVKPALDPQAESADPHRSGNPRVLFFETGYH